MSSKTRPEEKDCRVRCCRARSNQRSAPRRSYGGKVGYQDTELRPLRYPMAFVAEPDSPLSRRTFLRQSILGSLFLSFGGLVRPLLGQGVTTQSLLFFPDPAFKIMEAVATRVIDLDPSSPLSPTEVALRADRFLAAEPPEIQDQFHTLLYAFNAPFFAFLFDLPFSSFIGMRSEEH